ncbi:MAG: hypothetical protein LAP39_23505 [Acidobacteriia bacterium]|nr:hypothetical protein [Terriglobia bacterium]
MKNVLIVDNDLGFAFWLGRILDAAGYETLPAKGIGEALALLREVPVRIDVLMVLCSLPGANVFAAELRGSQRGLLKTIALIDQDDERSESMAAWDGWQIKPKLPDGIARKIFLSLVQSILTNGAAVPTT